MVRRRWFGPAGRGFRPTPRGRTPAGARPVGDPTTRDDDPRRRNSAENVVCLSASHLVQVWVVQVWVVQVWVVQVWVVQVWVGRVWVGRVWVGRVPTAARPASLLARPQDRRSLSSSWRTSSGSATACVYSGCTLARTAGPVANRSIWDGSRSKRT